MHQDRDRFSVHITDGTSAEHKGRENTRAPLCTRSPATRARGRSCGGPAKSRGYTKQSTCDYGLQDFQEASVPRYWLPKRQHTKGNGLNTKVDIQILNFSSKPPGWTTRTGFATLRV